VRCEQDRVRQKRTDKEGLPDVVHPVESHLTWDRRRTRAAFFIATAGLVLAQVLDPAGAEKIVGMIAGIIP
jgi:hypothetical protein